MSRARRPRTVLRLTRPQLCALALLTYRVDELDLTDVVRNEARSALAELERALRRACEVRRHGRPIVKHPIAVPPVADKTSTSDAEPDEEQTDERPTGESLQRN